MRIKEGQIFNLMDTNGRRNDVINALQGYLTILDDIQNEQKMNWASMPESLAQYEFYRQAIELSPEVFGKHGPYDKLAETLERNKDFATAVQTQDMEWIQKNSFMFQSLVKQFDLGIEDRARHYTSNLVKLGFTDECLIRHLGVVRIFLHKKREIGRQQLNLISNTRKCLKEI